MTKKASDANKLLCDNNTVKTHHVNRSDFFKKLGFLDKIFSKKKLFVLFPTKFIRMSRRIKLNIANDQKSFRRERIIAWQQHCKDSSSQSVRLGFVDKIFSKKKFFVFFNKVCKDVKANKERWTSLITIKASDAIEFLWDNHSNHAEPHVF